ncbi:MAG: thiamine phosphate synthase, partial [Longimicrobiales bacterium]
MSIPRLHVVTDDVVLDSDRFDDIAGALLAAYGAAIALHLRGPTTSPRRLLSLANSLLPRARAAGALLLVNDRVDVALAAGADGVHLGLRSIPPGDARSLVGDRLIGCSVHTAGGAAAVARWTDFLFLGTIYPTPSHPREPGAGPALVAAACARTGVPVLAIGGVTPDRIAGLVEA